MSGKLDKAPRLSINIVIWILSSDTETSATTPHTAPESVKRVKSMEQILVKNKMEAERLSQC